MRKKIKLGDIIKPRKEKVLPAEFPNMPFIGMEHVEAHTMRLLGTVPALTMKSAANRFYADDVLYGRLRPYLNKVYKPQCDGLCSAEFIVFPKTKGIHPDFLRYRLNAQDLISFASHLDTGDRPRVNFEGLSSFEFYFPLTFEEQQRIVTEIETQFSRLDEAIASLKRIQANLKRYKAAVLKAAVEGKLTEQWRKDHPDVEPADQLLKRILAERRTKWEESVGAKQGVSASPGFGNDCGNDGDSNKGEAGESFASPLPMIKAKQIKPKDDSWKKKYKEPAGPDMTNLPELPDGWVWSCLDQLTSKITDGEHISPKTVDIGIPLLSAKDVQDYGVVFSDAKHVSPEDADKFRTRCEPEHGDILIVSRGATIGRTCQVKSDVCFCLMGSVILAKTLVSYESRYLSASLKSMTSQKAMLAVSGSTAQQAIYIRDIRSLPIPIPPAAEQTYILEELDRRFSVTDELETTIATSLKRAERLRQTILQQAFSGELL